jgi:hypothetical protein
LWAILADVISAERKTALMLSTGYLAALVSHTHIHTHIYTHTRQTTQKAHH